MKNKLNIKRISGIAFAASIGAASALFPVSSYFATEVQSASEQSIEDEQTNNTNSEKTLVNENNTSATEESPNSYATDSSRSELTNTTNNNDNYLDTADDEDSQTAPAVTKSGSSSSENSNFEDTDIKNNNAENAESNDFSGTGATNNVDAAKTINGWKLISGKYYYYKNNVKYTGWHYMTSAEGEKINHWSYFGSDGVLRTGWVQLGQGTANPDGKAAKHWSYFGDNGWLRTGWAQLGQGTANPDGNASKHWSYFGENGWLRTGWVQLGQGTANPDGNASKHWSYFGDNGWLRTYWQQLGIGTPNPDGNSPAHYSYFGNNGWLNIGTKTIDGKSYTFDNKGWLITGSVSSSDANKNIASGSGASSVQLIANGCYRISPAKNTGYSIDVWGGLAADNTKLWSYENNETGAQYFQIMHLGNNVYSIKTGASIYSAGWDISGGKSVAGASLIQKKYTGASTQKWKIVSAGNGYYTIKPYSGNLVIDIAGGKLSQGDIKLAAPTGSDTQKFKITKASGFLIRNGRKYYFNSNGDKPMIGVDVSAWSETVDWAKVKADGIEFAIIRASHRGGQVDKYAARNMAECTRLGIPFGVYCYSYATTNAQADHEVDVLLSTIKGYKPALGVFIDVEDNDTYTAAFGNIYSASARRKITDITKRMVARVQNAGYLAGVYGNEIYLNQILYLNEMPNARWVAKYFTNTTTDSNIINLAGKGYKIWQFTDQGYVNGVPNSGSADLNTLIEKYW